MSSRPLAEEVQGFVANEADVAVLLRRGLGKKTLMIRWNLTTDEFEIGQWLFAWVFDGAISPDGQLLIYRAEKPIYDPKHFTPAHYRHRYMAVCRPPFFTALAFWNDSSGGHRLRWSEHSTKKPVQQPHKGTLPSEYRSQLVVEKDANYPFVGGREYPPLLLRPSKAGELILYRECLQPHFYSLNNDLFEADWAEVDHRGRVLFARAGRIYVLDQDGERELIDLNPYEFHPVKPPAWATQWP